MEARCGEAEKALSAILKAANNGLKAAAAGKEEAHALGEALRAGAENAPAAPPSAAPGGRTRHSTSRQGWR